MLACCDLTDAQEVTPRLLLRLNDPFPKGPRGLPPHRSPAPVTPA